MRKFFGLITILLIALSMRLGLAPLGFHVDILSNAGWGEWIFTNGPLGFYSNSIWIFSWPTQPPFVSLLYGFDRHLYLFLLEMFRASGNIIVKFHLAPGHMVWFFEFIKWFDTAKLSTEAVFPTGYLITIKLLPIIADLGIALLIFKIANDSKKAIKPLIWPLLYLISPFSFYLSALWGQYDQLAYLVLLSAFLLESSKKIPWLTPFLLAVSIATKPTGLILVPLFLFLYYKNKHPIRHYIVSFILIIVFFFITTNIFTNENFFYFVGIELTEKIFFKSSSRLSANAFNFWRLFTKTGGETASLNILFIPAYIWSVLIYIYISVKSFKLLKPNNLKSILTAIFLTTAGSWLFLANMLDRYFFAGITTGLLLCIYDKRILKYWIIMSLIFAVNLYNQWWFPESFDVVKKLLTADNGAATKILSLINIFAFYRIMQLLTVKNSKINN